ncbi:hypothetical protein OA104_01675 [Candidatus Pelagibacter sp.]|nr:hypothetical protein [Candidatus Pelagibacter sp.]
MAISRNMMERQLRAGGGIMTLEEPRQGYFLGKIVKKAKRAVKKVVKSPLGKIALGGAALYGLGGGGIGGKFLPFLKNTGGFSLRNLGANLGIGSITRGIRGQPTGFAFDGPLAGLFSKDGKFSLGRTALTGLGAAALAAPFLMGGDEEEDPGIPVSGVQPMVADIRNQAQQFYRDPAAAAASGLFFMPQRRFVQDSFLAADGGLADIPREGYAEGGIMDLGGMEKDYREGGFVPIGAEERADDVPARLSKNEFVFTADAVRNAGGGDIDKGAEVMQNMMDNLEAGGMISEESQGKENPAQAMFDQAQMMESRIV